MLRHSRFLVRAAMFGLIWLVCVSPAHAQQVTTLIVHGYSLNQSKGVWIESMADAVLARADTGGGAICRYDQATGQWRLVSGTIDANQPIVLIARWLEDFDKQNVSWGYLEGASDALYAALRDARFADGGGQPIAGFDLIDGRHLHMLGHSRGGVVISEIAQRFGSAGIAVDHVTFMDPHPVNGTLDAPYDFDWGDPVPQRWSNVTFADNYWRADGGGLINGLDFDGMPVSAAHNVQLSESALDCCAYGFAHLDTHLWYHGTVDLSPNPCDGEQCINAEMRNTWWPDGYTERGYYYARLGGGAAQRPALPEGDDPGTVPVLYGGSFEQRTAAGWLYHGGMTSGSAIVNESGRTFLRLGSGFATSATHNRLFLPAFVRQVRFNYRIFTGDTSGDDTLRISFTEQGGNQLDLTDELSLATATADWTGPAVLEVPLSLPRDAAYTVTFTTAAGGATLEAVVGIDDIELAKKPADIDGNGVVDVFDLIDLLKSWGPCDAPCPPYCPQDITDAAGAGRDCMVDVFDLLALLGDWG